MRSSHARWPAVSVSQYEQVTEVKVVDQEPKVRRRRPQARSVEAKAKIMEAAGLEFATKGFEGASTRAIAKAAGVEHPMVTYHYQTKIGLWKAVVSHLNELWDQRYTERLAGLRGVDDVTTLRLILEEFIYFSGEHQEFHWLMSDVAREKTERLSWVTEQWVTPKVTKITQLIASAQKTGDFIPGQPGHLYYIFMGSVTRLFMVAEAMHAATGLSVGDKDFLARHAELCLGLFFPNKSARI